MRMWLQQAADNDIRDYIKRLSLFFERFYSFHCFKKLGFYIVNVLFVYTVII